MKLAANLLTNPLRKRAKSLVPDNLGNYLRGIR